MILNDANNFVNKVSNIVKKIINKSGFDSTIPATIQSLYIDGSGREFATVIKPQDSTPIDVANVNGLILYSGDEVYITKIKNNLGNSFIIASKNNLQFKREVLTANRTYYVSLTGNDSNNGLTTGTPFLTIQHTIDIVASLDMSIFSITIDLWLATGIGTIVYDEQIVLKDPVGAGNVTITGNTSDVTSVTLFTSAASSSTTSIINTGQKTYIIQWISFDGNDKDEFTQGIVVNGGFILVNNINGRDFFLFMTTSFQGGGTITVSSNIKLSNDISIPFDSNSTGIISLYPSTNVDTDDLTSIASFVRCRYGGLFINTLNAYSNLNVTGLDFVCIANAVIETVGNTLPGTIAGTPATGGVVL